MLVGVGGIALFGSVIAGIRARRKVAVVVTATSRAVGLAAVGFAPWLHWRLSRAEFDRVAEGDVVACEDSSPCRLGWWNVERSELRGGLAIMWTTRRDVSCYAGFALAKMASGDAGEDAMRTAVDAAGFTARVTAFHDGWYELA